MSGSDDKIINNSSGIHSLAGLAFLIKAFAYYALCITKVNEFVEFETLDDINVRLTPKNIDKKVDNSVIGENNLQIILFDDKNLEELLLKPDNAECLVNDVKTGFIPFL